MYFEAFQGLLRTQQAPWVESISTAVVSGIQRHAQCAHVETEAAQQHQTRLQKLCDNFWSRVWFCCSRVRTNQKKVVKTTFQFQAIFPNQTLHQKDVTESAPLRSRRDKSIHKSRHRTFSSGYNLTYTKQLTIISSTEVHFPLGHLVTKE